MLRHVTSQPPTSSMKQTNLEHVVYARRIHEVCIMQIDSEWKRIWYWYQLINDSQRSKAFRLSRINLWNENRTGFANEKRSLSRCNKSGRRLCGRGKRGRRCERNENMGKNIARNRRQLGERTCSSRLSRDSKAHLHCVTGLFSATATLLRVIKPACVACRYSLTFAPSTDRLADFYFSTDPLYASPSSLFLLRPSLPRSALSPPLLFFSSFLLFSPLPPPFSSFFSPSILTINVEQTRRRYWLSEHVKAHRHLACRNFSLFFSPSTHPPLFLCLIGETLLPRRAHRRVSSYSSLGRVPGFFFEIVYRDGWSAHEDRTLEIVYFHFHLHRDCHP